MANPDPSDELPIEAALRSSGRQLNILWSKLAGIKPPASHDSAKEGECVRILFTAAEHGAGTTTVACAAALGLARNLDDSVGLVETNLYAPGMARYLGMDPTPGLTDCLDGRVEASEAIRNSMVERLYVLNAGTQREPIPGELMRDPARRLFREAAANRRYLLIDAPPLIDRPESAIQLATADYVVFVTRARSTQRGKARRAMQMILDSGTEVLGVVLNRFKSDLPFGKGAENWS